MRVIGAAVVASLAGSSFGAIVYDNITGNAQLFNGGTFVTSDTHELAQDLSLSGGPAVLQRVTLCLRNNAFSPYNAPVWMGVYDDSAGQPGTLLTSVTRQVQLGVSQILVLDFDPAPVQVPGLVWVSFKYEGQQAQVGICVGNMPSVGSSMGYSANRTFQTGSGPSSARFGIRLNSVPAPSTLAAAALLLATGRRRTRATEVDPATSMSAG